MSNAICLCALGNVYFIHLLSHPARETVITVIHECEHDIGHSIIKWTRDIIEN